MESSRMVAVATVLGAHGIRGEARLNIHTQSDAYFAPGQALYLKKEGKEGGKWLTISQSRPHKQFMLVFFDGISGRDAAAALRGLVAHVPREHLPETAPDEHYWVDLVGMKVVSMEGEHLGKVVSIIETGANDVFVVQGQKGEILIPALDWVIKEINSQTDTMVVDLPQGL
ncbi:MAG: ribosome maturation factor RimM [Desulfatibacillaceae bacterium]|nr:ribosome maturation factor RimM [Desulfatibacillaceae bacterium]